jgi:alpha-L-fucosidase
MKHPKLASALLLPVLGLALSTVPSLADTDRDERMAWFREARFGLFLHWGVYSVSAGEYHGHSNYGEWFLEETKMPVSQYEKFAGRLRARNQM